MESKLIGKTVATEKNPTTIDEFYFWTKPEVILHPFDVIKVKHLMKSSTFGVVEEISHFTDAASAISNFISSDFGDADLDETTYRIRMNCVKAKVIYNNKGIDTPVFSEQKVYLATEEEVALALGLKDVKNPVTCGYLEMYKDTGDDAKISIPVNLNSDFLIGPEGAHLNISGVSGLASKTSYAMFLLKSIQDHCLKMEEHKDEQFEREDDGVAIVVFNVKGKDLLAIDKPNTFNGKREVQEQTFKLYQNMGLSTTPFKNVTYLYPAYDDCTNERNSYVDKELFNEQLAEGKAFKYKFECDKFKDLNNIGMLFSNIEDTNQTMESIINFILTEQGRFRDLQAWDTFLERVHDMCESGSNNSNKEISVLSWRKFYRIVKKAISGNMLFDTVNRADHDVRIADKIKNLHANDVCVIDIAKLNSDMQSFVFGDTVQEIMNYQLAEKEPFADGSKPPSRIIIFIDELNKYASTDTPKSSPILHQILDIAERGRSLGVILFGAEQFMSAIHNRVTGNCANYAYGKTNAIEISKNNYKFVPNVYKNMMTRLRQGDYIIQSSCLNSLLHIKFPLPLYKQFK